MFLFPKFFLCDDRIERKKLTPKLHFALNSQLCRSEVFSFHHHHCGKNLSRQRIPRAPSRGREARRADVVFFRSFFFATIAQKEKTGWEFLSQWRSNALSSVSSTPRVSPAPAPSGRCGRRPPAC